MKFVVKSEQNGKYVESLLLGRTVWTTDHTKALPFYTATEAFRALAFVPESSRSSVKIIEEDGTIYNVTKSRVQSK